MAKFYDITEINCIETDIYTLKTAIDRCEELIKAENRIYNETGDYDHNKCLNLYNRLKRNKDDLNRAENKLIFEKSVYRRRVLLDCDRKQAVESLLLERNRHDKLNSLLEISN